MAPKVLQFVISMLSLTCLRRQKRKNPKTVHRMPLLTRASNEGQQSNDDFDLNVYKDVMYILKLNVPHEDKAELIARRVKTETNHAAKQFQGEKDRAAKQLTDKNNKIEKLTKERDDLQRIKDVLEKEIVAPAKARATIDYVEDTCSSGYKEWCKEFKRLNPKLGRKSTKKEGKEDGIVYPKVPDEEYAYSKENRENLWVWMLEYRTSNAIIEQLLDKLKHYKTGAIEHRKFAHDIATAYGFLSRQIHHYFCSRSGTLYWDLTPLDRSDYALEILLSTVKLKSPSKYIVA